MEGHMRPVHGLSVSAHEFLKGRGVDDKATAAGTGKWKGKQTQAGARQGLACIRHQCISGWTKGAWLLIHSPSLPSTQASRYLYHYHLKQTIWQFCLVMSQGLGVPVFPWAQTMVHLIGVLACPLLLSIDVLRDKRAACGTPGHRVRLPRRSVTLFLTIQFVWIIEIIEKKPYLVCSSLSYNELLKNAFILGVKKKTPRYF